MISYGDLLKKRREEEENKQTILSLTDQDLIDISELFEVLRKRIEEAKNEEEVDAAKTQFDNAKRAFHSLIKTRINKLLHYSLLNIEAMPFDRMNSIEKRFFENLNQNVKEYLQEMDKITTSVIQREIKQQEEHAPSIDIVKVEILQDLNKFQGAGASYGPYKKGDVVELPKNIAEALIKSQKARQI
jgi:DNA replication initiation complex subunit (GINS family)